MENTKIALVQMQSIFGNTEYNLNKITEFINRAAEEKADIICFPELCVQGYSRDRSGVYSEPVPGPSTNRLSEAVKNSNMTAIVGMAEKSGADKPYITQLLIEPDGRLLKYRKTHLGNSEKPYFSSGEKLPVFDLNKAKVGIEICWDLHFPEITTIMSMAGAEIIFAPHASPSIVGDRRGIWLKYMTARAYDNAVYLAACNLVGEDGTGHCYCGGAMVIDPKGNVVAESFNKGEGMLLTELDAKLINTIRNRESVSMSNSFYLHSRRPELYHNLIKENSRAGKQ
ncbi:Predicted amidohydrolase [Desulfotomaculum arcticum]|uniref:Predicted amidohydrolase n=1 Tax=Desulfotruncus arcticus DSM 17038 TaxID=1121424 RepID=A0A1I2N428_9FIRM|nr:nitrilase family protein [Desulfotruncus arcticus]SFF98158.1 Predicted amidohydrolase [Desulfotomaculum arcticum] [Desulfotruncus arcticus DSM 17038]